MNASVRQAPPAVLEAESEIKEIVDYVKCVRHEIDLIWGSARDATAPSPTCTPEANRVSADDAAFEALQCLHHVETHLQTLSRVVTKLQGANEAFDTEAFLAQVLASHDGGAQR